MIHPVIKKSARKSGGRKRSPRVTDLDDDKRDDILQKSDMNNQKLEAYYRKQLAMEDDEWSTFLDTCREPLPSTFRICGSRECVVLHFVHPCAI
jgi:multisite-specific tRNA:(cytosine-C5)-methyltransferase